MLRPLRLKMGMLRVCVTEEFLCATQKMYLATIATQSQYVATLCDRSNLCDPKNDVATLTDPKKATLRSLRLVAGLGVWFLFRPTRPRLDMFWPTWPKLSIIWKCSTEEKHFDRGVFSTEENHSDCARPSKSVSTELDLVFFQPRSVWTEKKISTLFTTLCLSYTLKIGFVR